MPDARKTVRWSVALLAYTLAAAGCQLFVDLDGLEDMSCPPDYKACNGGCVSELDTATGCGDFGCNPCAPQHAEAICDNKNHCSFTKCIGTWANCNMAEDDACETDTAHTAKHCGGCFEVCEDQPHATAGCSDGMCAIGKCEDGWVDCDEDPENGCEHNLLTDPPCVRCRVSCPEGSSCQDGVCRVPVTDGNTAADGGTGTDGGAD
jgi:hypothetical protein